MKFKQWITALNLLMIAIFLVGCSQSSCRRCQKYWGREYLNTRHVPTREDFMHEDESLGYLPLTDEDAYGNRVSVRDTDLAPPSRFSPGEMGSSVPGIDGFQDVSSVQGASGVFKTVHFPYNSSLIKDKESLDSLQRMSGYMKEHPKTFIFVEGHCDQRGAEAYNLALGARRANAVRNLLIKEGVSPDHIFTISYGKERPIARGDTEESWKQNRRAQFKIYQG